MNAALPPLAATLATSADFVLEVLATSARAPFGQLSWLEINRLAARWLRPTAAGDTSHVGHLIVLEMMEHGLVDAELTTARDGRIMVQRVTHPRFDGLTAALSLAA